MDKLNSVIDCVLDLVDSLEGSCTQYSNEEAVGSHGHDLFDYVDKQRFEEISNSLRGLKGEDNG